MNQACQLNNIFIVHAGTAKKTRLVGLKIAGLLKPGLGIAGPSVTLLKILKNF